MAPGLPARVVILCVVLTGARITHAEGDRRTVAVIDLSGDPAATGLRKALYNQLLGHWALGPVGDSTIDSWLEGELVDEDKARIDRARKNRDAAEAALFDFRFDSARTEVDLGRKDLASVTPTPVSTALYAELEIQEAYADFNEHRPAMARKLALVYRLAPRKTLDAARYAPEFIEAFEAAKRAAAKASVEVKGEGRVWIDGIDVGPAPAAFETTTGDHLVQITGPERETTGVAVTVPGPVVEFAAAPASPELEIRRGRLALSRVPDAAARAGAMKQLADLLAVHDAVLITKNEDGKLVVQTWHDPQVGVADPHEPGFSKPREYHGEPPNVLLTPLAPPKPAEPPKPKLVPFVLPPLVVEKPWYRQRWVQGTFATGAIAAIVGAILWVRRDKFVGINPNIQTADGLAR